MTSLCTRETTTNNKEGPWHTNANGLTMIRIDTIDPPRIDNNLMMNLDMGYNNITEAEDKLIDQNDEDTY